MVTAYERMREFAFAQGRLGELEKAVVAHLRTGYVFSTPEAFLIGRPVPIDAPDERISDPSAHFPDDSDSWFVWAAAGDISEILKFIPYRKKWVAWARRGVIRFYRFEVIDKIHNLQPYLNNGIRRR